MNTWNYWKYDNCIVVSFITNPGILWSIIFLNTVVFASGSPLFPTGWSLSRTQPWLPALSPSCLPTKAQHSRVVEHLNPKFRSLGSHPGTPPSDSKLLHPYVFHLVNPLYNSTCLIGFLWGFEWVDLRKHSEQYSVHTKYSGIVVDVSYHFHFKKERAQIFPLSSLGIIRGKTMTHPSNRHAFQRQNLMQHSKEGRTGSTSLCRREQHPSQLC